MILVIYYMYAYIKSHEWYKILQLNYHQNKAMQGSWAIALYFRHYSDKGIVRVPIDAPLPNLIGISVS